MSPIVVDSDAFSRAADSCRRARDQARQAIESLTATLDTDWGCAGTDPSGGRWAQSYDPAAAAAVRAGTDLTNAYAKLHDLMAFTAVNHTNAQHAATLPPEPPSDAPQQLDQFVAPRFRGAFGGHKLPPFGWTAIVSIAADLVWPNGDADELRKLQHAWLTAAKEVRAARDGLGASWSELEALTSPEMPQVLAQLDVGFTFADDTAQAFDYLADTCSEWAWHIEQTHRDIEKILANAVAAEVIVGAITAIATAGFATAAVESGVAAATALSVGGMLATLDGAAIASAAAAAGAGVAVIGAAKAVQPLLQAQPTVFGAVATGRGQTLQYHPPPKELKAFSDARRVKKLGNRARWEDSKGRIYEWDYQHGCVEKYSKNGKHLGEFDADTGAQTKPADPTRRVER